MSFPEDQRQEIVDATPPHAPVVAAGEGAPQHVDRLGFQHFVVLGEGVEELLLAANRRVAEILREESEKVLKKVLDEASNVMKNQYSRSDV